MPKGRSALPGKAPCGYFPPSSALAMVILSTLRQREDSLQFLDQRGKVLLQNGPENVVVYGVVAMDEAVAQARSASLARDIEFLRLGFCFGADGLTEEAGGVEVHFAAEEFGEFALEGEEMQAHPDMGLKLNQNVYIAVGAEVVA